MAHVLIQLSLSPIVFLALLAYNDRRCSCWMLTMLFSCLHCCLCSTTTYCLTCILWSMFCIALLVYCFCSPTILLCLYSMVYVLHCSAVSACILLSMFYIALLRHVCLLLTMFYIAPLVSVPTDTCDPFHFLLYLPPTLIIGGAIA